MTALGLSEDGVAELCSLPPGTFLSDKVVFHQWVSAEVWKVVKRASRNTFTRSVEGVGKAAFLREMTAHYTPPYSLQRSVSHE